MKVQQPGGNIDQLLRQTRVQQMQLSAMADTKANMLLTMSSVILTLAAAYTTDEVIKWAACCLMCFCLLTIMLAAFAAMPRFSGHPKRKARNAPRRSTFNILFFGDFTSLSLDDFEAEMEMIFSDPGLVYGVQVKEIYALGMFLLEKKYRYLRLAYCTFITGLGVSGIWLIITALYF